MDEWELTPEEEAAIEKLSPKRAAEGKKKRRLQERFEAWDKENPEVYTRFKAMAFQIRATGFKRYNPRTILNVIRWRIETSGRGKGAPFRTPKDYGSRIVRKLIAEDPNLRSLFGTR